MGRPPRARRRAPPRPGRSSLPRLPGWIWPACGGLALALLLFACRGAPLGVAVADDYAYLRYLRFHRGLDLFDSLGLAFYWRPLSRQAYFSAVAPWLLAAPWAAAFLHSLFLLVLFAALYRAGRRALAPPLAAAVAVFPLLSESSRVLLAWPAAWRPSPPAGCAPPTPSSPPLSGPSRRRRPLSMPASLASRRGSPTSSEIAPAPIR